MHAFPQIFLYTNLNKVFAIKKKEKEKSDKNLKPSVLKCLVNTYSSVT